MYFFYTVLSECSAHYVHFGYNIRLCVWSLYTSTLYWTVSEEACPHHESVWVCMRVSPLFRRGEKCYCSLAIAVFIYNDWAFAIQNVSLYIEYENIYDYICMKHENGLGLLLWQTAVEMIWIWFGGVNLILLCTMSASAEECVCVTGSFGCLFLSRRPAACPQTLTFSLQLQCRKKVKFKSASGQFHPITAWWRVTPSPKAGIIPLICIHMWLAGTPSLPCCQYTHHLVLLQHL